MISIKIGVISDVHINSLALKTIIEKFDNEKVDKIVCAGDLLCLGPNLNEVIKEMDELDYPSKDTIKKYFYGI